MLLLYFIIRLGVDGLARENLEPGDGGSTLQRLEYNVLLDVSSTIGSTYGLFGASDYPPVSYYCISSKSIEIKRKWSNSQCKDKTSWTKLRSCYLLTKTN